MELPRSSKRVTRSMNKSPNPPVPNLLNYLKPKDEANSLPEASPMIENMEHMLIKQE